MSPMESGFRSTVLLYGDPLLSRRCRVDVYVSGIEVRDEQSLEKREGEHWQTWKHCVIQVGIAFRTECTEVCESIHFPVEIYNRYRKGKALVIENGSCPGLVTAISFQILLVRPQLLDFILSLAMVKSCPHARKTHVHIITIIPSL